MVNWRVASDPIKPRPSSISGHPLSDDGLRSHNRKMVGWGVYDVAPGPTTLADGSDIAAVSRLPGHMEMFYI